MPDLLAGTLILAGDTPNAVFDEEPGNLAGITGSAWQTGDPICGVSFIAPTSGRVLVTWTAQLEGDTGEDRARVSARVRTGGTLDAGVSVSGPSASNSVESPAGFSGGLADAGISCGTFRMVDGLTPYETYNAVTQHSIHGTSGTIRNRGIAVIPLP